MDEIKHKHYCSAGHHYWNHNEVEKTCEAQASNGVVWVVARTCVRCSRRMNDWYSAMKLFDYIALGTRSAIT